MFVLEKSTWMFFGESGLTIISAPFPESEKSEIPYLFWTVTFALTSSPLLKNKGEFYKLDKLIEQELLYITVVLLFKQSNWK